MGSNKNLNNTKRKINRLTSNKISSSVNSASQNGNLISPNNNYHPPKKRLSIRFRAILVAIAISVIPVSLVSITTYILTKRSANKEVIQAQEQIAQIQLLNTQKLAEQFQQFLQARFSEIAILAENQIFTDPSLWNSATLAQKTSILTSFQAQINLYDQIIFLDLQGNPLFHSLSSQNLDDNYGDRHYFQEAIATKQIVVSKPELNTTTGLLEIDYAAPIINVWTGKVTGVIYLSLPEKQIAQVFTGYTNNNQNWYLIDNEGNFFAGSNLEYLNQKAHKFFPKITKLYAPRRKEVGIYFNQSENNQQLISYAPVSTQGFYPAKYLGAIITTEVFPKYIALENGSWILLLGISTTALIVGAIAAYLANRLTVPIINSMKAVELLSRGKLDTRISIQGKDELAMLGTKINQMAEKLMYLIERQTMLAKTSELMARIARARSVQQLQSPFNRFLAEVRFLIKADRLIFYQFDQNWSGTVIAESVAKAFPNSLGAKINDPCFAQNYVDKYRRGRIQATRNIYEAGLTQCHIKQLEGFAVKANLVIPVVVKTELEQEQDELIGLLIAHQCSSTRIWNDPEVDYLKDVASQLGLALRGYGICKQVLEQQENFQQEVSKLIDNYQQLSSGNLTISSSANYDNLNELNEFLKYTVTGINKIIVRIKTQTQIVTASLDTNKDVIVKLKRQIQEQSEQVEDMVAALEPIINYIQIIYKNINETSKISQVSISQAGMEKTNLTYVLESISLLQKTVSESIKKVKNVEQMSIEIIGTIPILKKIILQSELLAKKIDAQPIGTQNPLSENIKKIAFQLGSVTSEIETIGERIQQQALEIVRTMEIDSSQVSGVTPIAENTNKNIAKIFKTSVEIDHLLQVTNNSTASQMTAFQKITNLVTKLTQLSERSSNQSQQAANSIEVTEVAIQRLQESVNAFKVKE